MNELSITDAKNLLVFLQRVQLHASEVDAFVDVRNKLQHIAAGPSPVAPSEE